VQDGIPVFKGSLFLMVLPDNGVISRQLFFLRLGDTVQMMLPMAPSSTTHRRSSRTIGLRRVRHMMAIRAGHLHIELPPSFRADDDGTVMMCGLQKMSLAMKERLQ
jgi:hypothetical protein